MRVYFTTISIAVRCAFNNKTCWITLSSVSSGTRISRIMSSEAGNKNSSDEEKLPPECYQEDALDYDCYQGEDEEGPYKTREQKLQMLEQLDNKGYCPLRLEEVYPNTEITTEEKLAQQIKQFEQLKKQMEYKEYCESENPFIDTKKQQEENKDGPEK